MKLIIILLVCLIIQGCNKEEGKLLANGIDIKEALVNFKSQKKFVEDRSELYPGAPDEQTRLQAESIINDVVDELLALKDNNLSEREFWIILKSAAMQLQTMDSEEMDQGLYYMEKLMDIYGIESSDGRLNQWRYGFDPSSH
ncbi:DUF4844 domain-containing protein [Aestuariibacter sp. GS-14]|uniref:DUF4844 domain-containing protein n=1 Tax=Aestuariibacter sp. GS-14 TaxID=2590670 RepID=UPI00112A6676|nr:DUF4844 domain-containing protein [Aestuariibacter sp. GS-14]TPV56952.1 DUF4844 domain-containing protein [Aestuariibacter sp. GS-14]